MMRGGRIGGIAAMWLLLFVCIACEAEEHLFVNGARVDLALASTEDGGELHVSLSDLAPRVGVELSHPTDESIDLRWAGGRLRLSTSDQNAQNDEIMVSIDWLLDLVGGTARRLGNSVHVETEPAAVTAFDADGDDVVIRFDRFAPREVIEAGSDIILARFHHVTSDQPVRAIVFPGGPLSRAEMRVNGLGGVDLILSLREIGALRVRTYEADAFYSATLGLGAETASESICILEEGFRLVEIEQTLAFGSASVAYVHLDDSRARFRVEPEIKESEGEPEAKNGTRMVKLGLVETQDLLVIDGSPHRLPEEPMHVLSIDAFGRFESMRIQAEPFLRLESMNLPLDGFNRPLVYDELVAYAPGYEGELAPGVPGRFTVIKIRGGRVVSAFEGAFIDRDETATLIVASGEAGSRLSEAALGQDAQLLCMPIAADGSLAASSVSGTLVDALTIDSVLMAGGLAVDSLLAEDLASSWSVLAVDVLGGLTLLIVPQDERSAGVTRVELLALLGGLPARVIDAFALSRGTWGPLWLRPLGSYTLGSPSQSFVDLVVRSIDE